MDATLIVSQMLTLYTTPIIYLYLDRFRLRPKVSAETDQSSATAAEADQSSATVMQKELTRTDAS